MIEFTHGDLFEANVDTLVCPVNCIGVMGAGLALEFKKRYPHFYRAYYECCRNCDLTLGRIYVYDVVYAREAPPVCKHLVAFPTKFHWKDKSEGSYIDAGLQELRRWVDEARVPSVALPALGCGLGGLTWADVRGSIERAFEDVEARVRVYEPY